MVAARKCHSSSIDNTLGVYYVLLEYCSFAMGCHRKFSITVFFTRIGAAVLDSEFRADPESELRIEQSRSHRKFEFRPENQQISAGRFSVCRATRCWLHKQHRLTRGLSTL